MKSNALSVVLAAAVLASCGAGSSATDQTTLGLTSTNYVTVSVTPTTTTTTTIAGQLGTPGLVHPEAGSYVVVAGDYPANIASRYKVVFNDFLAANGWTLVGDQVPGFPAPGATIVIPPGWTEPGTATDTTLAGSGDTTPTETTTTIAGGQSSCAPGEYTIVEGDFLGRVATKLDTTVEALNAANADTKGYASFFPGLKIKTPPKENC
jgi:LysM repeat protein